MVFGRKSKMAIMQQQQQLAALQAQIRSMQASHANMPVAAPTEVHHHTREIVNNVPQYIPVPLAEAATFVAPTAVAPAVLPAAMPAVIEELPMTPMTPIAQIATPLEVAPQGPFEYISHTQRLDGTWEHNSWWE